MLELGGNLLNLVRFPRSSSAFIYSWVRVGQRDFGSLVANQWYLSL